MSNEIDNTYIANNGRGHAPSCPDWLHASNSKPAASEADACEPIRFEPLLTPDQARERLAEMVEQADEWIERIGADGRRGWDRPGQAIKTRWWETTSFDDLPTWGDATSTPKPESPARKRSTERQQSL